MTLAYCASQPLCLFLGWFSPPRRRQDDAPRLIGASGAWFLMDFAYYGNTVSSPLVLSALQRSHAPAKDAHPAGHLRRLCRSRLRGFGADHGPPGAQDDPVPGLRDDGRHLRPAGPHSRHREDDVPFLIIYGFSFFFTEFGPNATTFVYPSEIFPVRVRTTAHGVCAAMGKIGGFFGVFLFPYLMHWQGLPAAETAAAIASVCRSVDDTWMLPETKGKSLEELSSEPSTPAERAA